MKELIYNKGYLLKIVSWENDADLYKNIEIQSSNLTEIKAYQRICLELFCSKNSNTRKGIGNTHESDSTHIIEDKIRDFIENEPFFNNLYSNLSDDDLYDTISSLAEDLLGYSDFYRFRICGSAKLYEVADDIFLTKL